MHDELDQEEDVVGSGVMQGKKLFYEETYVNGDWCEAKILLI